MPYSRSPFLSRKAARHLQSYCPSCRRHLSASAPTSTSNPPPPLPSAYARLSTRRLISLHGRDASHFLQGLTTQNIPPSGPPTGFYSAFLNASGRVLHDVFIYPASHSKAYRDSVLGEANNGDPGLLIEVDANEVGALAKHLKRYKLRAKVGIKILEPKEWGVWSAWGSNAQKHAVISGIGCLDKRAPDMGYRVVLQGNEKISDFDEEVTVESYDLRRTMMGVAEGQREILKETALPQESNIDYMGGIDFRKGCYVGQELTIRTHHTGVVRKRILPVQIFDPGENSKQADHVVYARGSKLILPPKGANISKVDKKGRSAGRWLGGVGNVGLALCRLEAMTDTVLTGEGSQWSPEHEFKIAWEPEEGRQGGEVKIEAFVPSWHKDRAEAQKLHRS